MRPPRNDVFLAAAVAAAALVEVRFNGGVHPKWAGLVTELPFSFALAWRRRLPLLAVLLLAAGWGLEPALGVPVDQPVVPLLAVVIALYSLGRHLPLPRALAGFALAAVGGSVSSLHIHGDAVVKLGNAVFGIVIAGGFFVVGVVVRAATREAAAHARRAERLEGERAAAVAEERARIARELHDVIAHSVSVMVVQAGAAAEMLKRTPERAAEPLEAVQETGRQALVEMSRLVGLLREDAEELGLAPQPGLAGIDALLAQVRESGLPVELRVEGQARPVPLGVDLSAYRVVQEALTNALKHADERLVVGEAEDGAQAVDCVRDLRPDVVLMDVRMPTLDGIAATRRIVAEGLPTRVLVLTTFDQDEIVYDALKAGASGFLLKSAPPAKLVEAVRTVAEGDALLAPSVMRRLVEDYVRRPPPGRRLPPELGELTEREREVLTLIARGLTNAEIAASFVVSEATVKTHVNRVFSKLRLRDRVQAVVLAYETGLVQPGAQ